MMIHIIPDSVFTDFVIKKFDLLDPGNHKFLIDSDLSTKKLIYTKSENIKRIKAKAKKISEFK